MLNVFYHPLYTDGIDPKARFPRDRYVLLAERLFKIDTIEVQEPNLATRGEIITMHDADYVDRFLNGTLSDKEARNIGLRPWKPEIVQRTLRLTSGSLQALDHVLIHGGFAGNLAGGTHHAFRDHGSGYCVFNDIALCAHRALQADHINKVLILDLDVHQGDGTAAMLQDWPNATTVSIHGGKNFPFVKENSDMDIELPCETRDDVYLATLDKVLDALDFDDFDVLLYQAGVDALASDRLGRLAVSREGLDLRNRKVLDKAQQANLPTVILMGGGYAEPITDTVDAFEDLFKLAAEYEHTRKRA